MSESEFVKRKRSQSVQGHKTNLLSPAASFSEAFQLPFPAGGLSGFTINHIHHED